VLQCVAVCCSVLQCDAVCCSVLQCVAACCSVLQCVTVCCSVLQCVAVFLLDRYIHVCFDSIYTRSYYAYCKCDAVCCSLLQSVAACLVCCSVLQFVAVCFDRIHTRLYDARFLVCVHPHICVQRVAVLQCVAACIFKFMLQSGEDAQDASSCWSLFAKEPQIIWLFCGK